jgi:hypothetical protein
VEFYEQVDVVNYGRILMCDPKLAVGTAYRIGRDVLIGLLSTRDIARWFNA